MQLSILLPFLIYLVLLLYIGWRARRREPSEEEFLLSSRTLSLPAFVATLVTTWYGGILGIGEFVFRHGLSVWFVFGLPYYIFAVIFALLLAPRIRASGVISIPEMLATAYDKKIGLLSGLFIVFMTSPAPYILMLAVLLQHLLNIPFLVAVISGTLFSVIYVYWGGFRSVVNTDKLQFVFMFAGFMTLFFVLIMNYDSPLEILRRLDGAHRDLSGGMTWQNIFVWFLIASWTFIDPGFHQRSAAAASPEIARRGVLVSVGFWFLFDMLTMVCGLYAFVLVPQTDPLMAYPVLADTVLQPLFKGLFFVGLLAIIMSTIDSFTFISAISIGKDLWGRCTKQDEPDQNKLVRRGLGITALLAVLMIIYMPSVIDLWYNLGSLFIPPLLLPVVAVFFPAIRLNARRTLAVMLASFALSVAFFASGQWNAQAAGPVYPWGVEPFFPGLILSIVLYLGLLVLDRKKV